MNASPRQSLNPPAALRALLAGTVDYAGLFPPAALALEPALRNQRAYVGCADAWMLGSFVLPAAKFVEAEPWLGLFDATRPLLVSALGAKTATAAEFAAEARRVAAGMQALALRHPERVKITQLEIALPPAPDDGTLQMLGAVLKGVGCGDLPVFCEPAAAGEVESVLRLLGAQVADRPFGCKIRTGGVTAAAFPGLAEVAAALSTAAQHDLALKFTAGLHHPLRAHHGSVGTKMHGFLNMLCAALLARTGASAGDLEEVLAEESPSAFRAGDEAVYCGRHRLSEDFILAHRPKVASFGSCSFDEPREDLAGMLGR